jgi:hypothetical protein
MFYNARWYDVSLGRFAQADSIVPPGVQGLDRYAYVNNSPMNYVDPSGHEPKYGCYESSGNTCLNANRTRIEEGNGNRSSNPLLRCVYSCTLDQVDHATPEQQSEWFITLADEEGALSCGNTTPAYDECEYSFSSVENKKLLDNYIKLLQAMQTSELFSSTASGIFIEIGQVPMPAGFLILVIELQEEDKHNDLLTFENTLSNIEPSSNIQIEIHAVSNNDYPLYHYAEAYMSLTVDNLPVMGHALYYQEAMYFIEP